MHVVSSWSSNQNAKNLHEQVVHVAESGLFLYIFQQKLIKNQAGWKPPGKRRTLKRFFAQLSMRMWGHILIFGTYATALQPLTGNMSNYCWFCDNRMLKCEGQDAGCTCYLLENFKPITPPSWQYRPPSVAASPAGSSTVHSVAKPKDITRPGCICGKQSQFTETPPHNLRSPNDLLLKALCSLSRPICASTLLEAQRGSAQSSVSDHNVMADWCKVEKLGMLMTTNQRSKEWNYSIFFFTKACINIFWSPMPLLQTGLRNRNRKKKSIKTKRKKVCSAS